VTAAGSQRSRGAIVLHGLLSLRDSRWGLEADAGKGVRMILFLRAGIGCLPEVDIFTVGDATLDTSTPVRLGTEAPIWPANESVVVLAARNFCSSEARADLERLGGWDGEHGVCQLGFELVEDRLSQPSRDVAKDAGNSTSNRVGRVLGPDDTLRGLEPLI
jgi:hypothetical protein